MSNILPIVMMVAVFYLLIIRPQGKKAKELQKMLGELKKGDKVVTSGGLLGEISGIKDDEIVLLVQEGVRLRVLRSAVQGLQKPPAAEASKS
jgi:preprotein translocase subunit YajC